MEKNGGTGIENYTEEKHLTSKKMPSTARPSGAVDASPYVSYLTAFQCTK